MGYRSDVRAIFYWPTAAVDLDADKALRAEKYGLLKVLLNTTYKDLVETWNRHEQCFCFHDESLLVEFQVNDTKWYDDFDEIKGLALMKDELVGLGYAYEFVRIGEDDDDTEIDRSAKHDYKLSVRISTEIIA